MKGKNMKKLFLIISIILWQLSCLAIELTEAEIMPKKLLFAELPEDYPPEINELFEFYYNTSKELYSRIDDVTDAMVADNILRIYLQELSHDEIRRFVYLEWLAQKHITHYFWEFHDLHRWIFNTSGASCNKLLLYKQEILNLIYYPQGLYETNNDRLLFMGSLMNTRKYLYEIYKFDINEFDIVSLSLTTMFKPVTGKVNNVTPIFDNGEFEKSVVSKIRNYELIEFDTGDDVLFFLQAKLLANQTKIIIGKTYLIFQWNLPLPERLLLNKRIGTPINSYSPGWAFLIENDTIIPNNRILHGLKYFLDVDNTDSSEIKFLNTPVKNFWDRYNHFHKRILEGK